MRFVVSRLLVLSSAATLISTSALYGQESEPLEAPPVHKITEPLVAPPVSLDAFSGRTVKDRKAGYGIIKARAKNLPKVGTRAPDFELKTADGKAKVKLSSFRGQQPVVLIFGSVT